MRRRLTLFIVGTAAVILILAGLGTWYLSEQSVRSSALSEVVSTAQAVNNSDAFRISIPARLQPKESDTAARAELKSRLITSIRRIIAAVGRLDGAYFLPINYGNVNTSQLPQGLNLTGSTLDALATSSTGRTLSGFSGSDAWAAVHIDQTLVDGLPAKKYVLVVTRKVGGAPWSSEYLILAGALLLTAALVALWLSHRITRPLLRAVTATQRIASGDLGARVVPDKSDYPELKTLAEAIDSMGASLGMHREMERQFLLSISHELRTPLTSIRGYAEAIADGTAPEPRRAALVITNESRRLERLVGDLMDLSKLDARSFSFHIQRVDAVELVDEVAEEVRPIVASAELEISVQRHGEPLYVQVDPDRLDQVLANLLENATKFARSRVVIESGVNAEGVVITVEDDGPGIRPDEINLVFARHYTLDKHQTPGRPTGSGLGLAIAAELLRAMGARIHAESPTFNGGGTRMVVHLPRG